MLCSYYWLRAYRIDSTLIDEQKVFSFQEAYSFIDCWREDYPDAYSFRLSYPTEEWFTEQDRITAKKEEEATKEAEAAAKKAAEESVPAESTTPDAKPKRHRRTKAEMEAARAAEAAGKSSADSKKVRKK